MESERVEAGGLGIVMVLSKFYPLYAGPSRKALSLAQELRKSFATRVCFLTESVPGTRWLDRLDGFRVVRVPALRLPRGGTVWFLAWTFLVLLFLRLRYRVLHIECLSKRHMFLARMAMRVLRMQTAITLTLMGADDLVTVLQREGRGLLKYLTNVSLIGLSPELTRSCEGFGLKPDQVRYIPNGVDTDHFAPPNSLEKAALRRNLGLPADAFVVAFVGVVAARKGADVVVEAGVKLCAEHRAAFLVLVGPLDRSSGVGELDPQWISRLREKVASAALENRIRFVGEVDNVAALLRASDAFLFPTRKEGMPGALLEAMACGLACVTARLDGCTDAVIDHGTTGLLIDGWSPEDYAAALRMLGGEPLLRERMGKAARSVIEDRYSMRYVASLHHTLYSVRSV